MADRTAQQQAIMSTPHNQNSSPWTTTNQQSITKNTQQSSSNIQELNA